MYLFSLADDEPSPATSESSSASSSTIIAGVVVGVLLTALIALTVFKRMQNRVSISVEKTPSKVVVVDSTQEPKVVEYEMTASESMEYYSAVVFSDMNENLPNSASYTDIWTDDSTASIDGTNQTVTHFYP